METYDFRKMQKYCNEISKFKVSCECGHRILVPFNKDFKICNWCGKPVYRNEMIKFKHVLRNKLNEYNKILIKDEKVS